MFGIIGNLLKLKFSEVPRQNLRMGGSVLEKSCLNSRLQKRKLYKMNSMEIGQFITFSNSFFPPRNM